MQLPAHRIGPPCLCNRTGKGNLPDEARAHTAAAMIEPTMFDESLAYWRKIISDLDESISTLEENPLSVINLPDLLAEMQRSRYLARNILRGITATADMIFEFKKAADEVVALDVGPSPVTMRILPRENL